MEQWDAYYKTGEPAGQLMTRGEPFPDGLFHIISDVIVRHTDGSILVTQRDYKKELYPGYFEAGASGCITAGETPHQGALRELYEETGIRADSLTFVAAYSDLTHNLYYGYLCITDCKKDSIRLQQGETIAYRWLSKDEFLSFIETPQFLGPQAERWKPHLPRILAY